MKTRPGRPRGKDRGMNGLETAFSLVLTARERAGEILRWDYEPVKLRLADNTYFTPDFRVILADGEEVFYETKGFFRDDARVKVKVAAALHPYRFIVVTRQSKKAGGGWEEEHL